MRLVVSRAERPELTDADLATSALAGAPWARRAIWDRYSQPVRQLIRRSLGPRAEVDDLVQDVFLRVFKGLRTLRERSALRSFVFAIAINRVRRVIRRKKLRALLRYASDDPTLLDHPSSEASPKTKLAIARLYEILDTLAIGDREAFVLRYFEGLELAEMAVVTGASVSTVKRRLSRAVGRLALQAANDPFLQEFTREIETRGERP